MLLTALALAVSTMPSAPPERTVSAQARATIRIMSAVRLRVGSDASEEGRPVRLASIRTDDGRQQAAKLVEFE